MKKNLFLVCLWTIAFSGENAKIISVRDFIKNTNASYVKVNESYKLNFDIFPIASDEDSTWKNPKIPETFILKVPNGEIVSQYGTLIYKDKIIKELLWPWSPLKRSPLDLRKFSSERYVDGSVVVLDSPHLQLPNLYLVTHLNGSSDA